MKGAPESIKAICDAESCKHIGLAIAFNVTDPVVKCQLISTTS